LSVAALSQTATGSEAFAVQVSSEVQFVLAAMVQLKVMILPAVDVPVSVTSAEQLLSGDVQPVSVPSA